VILQSLFHWNQIINQSDALIREQAATFRKLGMNKEADEITAMIRYGWFYKSTT
jgi:hypothetical protein